MAMMQELAEQSHLGRPPKSNRGWFKPGDRRINRRGRPVGTKGDPADETVDRAVVTDGLMVLRLPLKLLACRIAFERGPWITNLPVDFHIVSLRVDARQGRLLLVLRSASFRRVARGAVIPEFRPLVNGLRWYSGPELKSWVRA
jgi:hypothetical protein